jgi:hypothetical protein
MPAQMLAHRSSARLFYVQGHHIVVVHGLRPSGSEVELRERVGESSPELSLALRCSEPALAAGDHYYLVQTVFAREAMRPSVRLVHRDGIQQLRVEPVCCASFRVTGASPSFDFDEAFASALRQLPTFSDAAPGAPLPFVEVLAMGAIYGGFTGFSRLFVHLEARPAGHPGGTT